MTKGIFAETLSKKEIFKERKEKMAINLSNHVGWIATFDGNKYLKINANGAEARKIAFKKIGQMNVGFFYPIGVSEEILKEYKSATGYELETAESIMQTAVEVSL